MIVARAHCREVRGSAARQVAHHRQQLCASLFCQCLLKAICPPSLALTLMSHKRDSQAAAEERIVWRLLIANVYDHVISNLHYTIIHVGPDCLHSLAGAVRCTAPSQLPGSLVHMTVSQPQNGPSPLHPPLLSLSQTRTSRCECVWVIALLTCPSDGGIP